MHEERCVCSYIPRITLETRLVVVMHCRELKKTTATSPLALEALPNSELHLHGIPERPLDLSSLHDQGRRVCVLFPSDDAKPLSASTRGEDPRPITLVVPDGNWRQASRVPKRVKGLENAERVTLPPGPPTAWGIRRETKESGLATYEAIARALGHIESKEAQARLEELFHRMVRETLDSRGYDKEGVPNRTSG